MYMDEQGPPMFKYYIAQRHAGCVVVRETKEGEKKMPAGLEVNLTKVVDPAVTQTDLQWMEECLVQFFQEKLAQLSQPSSRAASEVGSNKRCQYQHILEDEDTLSEKEEAALREDPVVGPILTRMDCLTGDQKKCIVTLVFGDRKSEDVAVEMEEKLWLICNWNIRTEPPPSHQLYHSILKPGKGKSPMQDQPLEEQLAQGRRRNVKEGPIVHHAPDLDRLEATFTLPAPY